MKRFLVSVMVCLMLFGPTSMLLLGCGEKQNPLEPKTQSGQKPGAQTENSSGFPTNQCTWYAASEFDKIAPYPGCNWHGNAGEWVPNAWAAGWKTYAYPTYYATAVGMYGMPNGTIVSWHGGCCGHVAIVRQVVQNGIWIQEKNWPIGAGVMTRFLYWSEVMNRSGYTFSGYIPPWRK